MRHAWDGYDGDMGMEAPLGSSSDLALIAFGGLLPGCMDGLLSQSVLGRGEECVSAAGGLCSGDPWPPRSAVQRLLW